MRVSSARLGFSNTSTTSAIPAGLRPPLPLKMTSSIASPRKLLADCSPSTHLNASTTFDLPQPLGPTSPVIERFKPVKDELLKTHGEKVLPDREKRTKDRRNAL